MRHELVRTEEYTKKFPKSFEKLFELRDYEYLFPPLSDPSTALMNVLSVMSQIHKIDNPYLSESYTFLLSIFNGGMLFGTTIYPGLPSQEDDRIDDLRSINKTLSESQLIPRGTIAIGMLSYGHDLLMRFDQKDDKVYVWDSDESKCSGYWNSIDEWLLEECEIAKKLLDEGLLDKVES